jgi:glycosyltransferase involved in cell wall biosynthesis
MRAPRRFVCPMRILTVSNCPLVPTQGSGYVITGYRDGLRALGHVVDAYGPEDFDPLPSLHGRARSYRIALGMAAFVLRRLRHHEYDVVELYGGESWLAVLLLRGWLRRRFLLVSHSNGIEPFARDRLREHARRGLGDLGVPKWYQLDQAPLFRLAFTAADAVVTVSRYDRRFAVERAYRPQERLLAIDNALPRDFLDLDVDFERPRLIGYCGSWIGRKGTHVLCADMARVLAEFADCRLVLVGVGAGFRATAHFPAELCERIEVIPFVRERSELMRLYQSFSILIVPSVYESFGLVMAEAMACGCALVATRTGFAADLASGEEAMLIDQPVSPHLYLGVRALLEDEPWRRRIAAAGYRRVQALSWPAAVRRLEASYADWLAERRLRL